MEKHGEEVQRYARVYHLWALGVGAVISGDFFGWQSGLVGGFLGLLICLSIVTVMYILLAFSISELSCAIPSAAGPYMFAWKAIGPYAAFITGLAESLKLIATCPVIVTGIGSYLQEIIGFALHLSPLLWVLFYIIFVSLNIFGVALSFRIQFVVTILSLLILVTFYVAAIFDFNYNCWVGSDCKNSIYVKVWKFSDNGISDVFLAFPFAMWFYLGMEELPLASEETIEPEKNMKWGIVTAMGTLICMAYSTLFFNSSISPGAYKIFQSTSPLLDGYKSVFNDNHALSYVSWILVVGLLCSFHSFVFCTGRLLFAIAREGLYPKWLSKVHSTRQTPIYALAIGGVFGCTIAVVLYYLLSSIGEVSDALIILSLTGALISYIFQLTSYIALKLHQPNLVRPYTSPFGLFGAFIALFLCIFLIGTIGYSAYRKHHYQWSLLGAAGYFTVGSAYYYYYFMAKRLAINEPSLYVSVNSPSSSIVYRNQ